MTGGYLGNANLKKSDTAVEWTSELVQEFMKCAQDPIYFAENYIKIVHVDRGLIPIVLYDYQKEIINKITNSRRVAVATSRQAGKTTTAVAVILHYIIFNVHKTVALLANKGDAAREILDRIQIAYEALPDWLQQGVVTWNKGSIELENGCKVIAAASSSSAIRGKSVSFLYIDETAFLENWDEFFTSVYPTISSGTTTKILLTSTPNGLNHYWKICKGAQEGTNGYEYVEVKWDRVPGRDQKWLDETLGGMNYDMEKFAQEFEVAWLGSSGTLIAGSKLKELSYTNPLLSRDGLSQYARPEPGRTYVLVADVSRGKGLDYSAFSIIDATEMPYKQVCVFRDNMVSPVDYASTIHSVAKLYNDAMALVEINDTGGQVADVLLLDFGYENMIFTENAGRTGKRVSGGYGRSADRGIRTTKNVKAVGCSILKMLIEQNQLLIPDFDTIQELSRFSRRGNSYEAESGSHDDLVMTLVLFSWLSDQTYFRDLTDVHTLGRLRDKTEQQIEDELLPFGFIDDGINDPVSEPAHGRNYNWL
jgi:hypothetical protein